MTETHQSLPDNLRVAIIGSGPSAFYAAEHLHKQTNGQVSIDMFERLPTPYGLVRGGVAPDHEKIKSVTKIYDRIAHLDGFRFFGNVTLGQDITRADLLAHYHAVIYAVGAQTDRRMDIPGEDLPGSFAATEFVGWYNAHPDYRDLSFDLSKERVAVIGNGNVAMDVARILACTRAELEPTDIADFALDALETSNIKEIYVIGRRGPAQVKFTTPELRELEELSATDVIVTPESIELDPLSAEFIEQRENRTAAKIVELLRGFAERGPSGKGRQLIFRFLESPVEIIGTDHVEAIKIVKNELRLKNETLRPVATDNFETLPVDLVFRSIGYQGVPLPDLPFDDWYGIIPNDHGRVIVGKNEPLQGEYVVGWIKRGPTGIIGTNKPDAQETVELLLEDAANGRLIKPVHPKRTAVEEMLNERAIRFVTYDEWHILDQLEQHNGAAVGRPRVKFSRVADMLAALDTNAHSAELETTTDTAG